MHDIYHLLCMLPMAVARVSSSRVTKSQREGQFWGFSSPVTMHCMGCISPNGIGGCPGHSEALAICYHIRCKWVTQSPITSCSRRDHSVRQASANRKPENSESKRCGLSAGKEVMGVHSARKLYNCLVVLWIHLCYKINRLF